MNNNVLQMILMATVGILLTGALLAPVISDYADGQSYTYTNSGVNVVRSAYLDITPDTELEFTVIRENNTLYTVVDDVKHIGNTYAAFFASDAFNLRSYGTNAGLYYAEGRVNNIYPDSSDNTTILRASISGGTVTFNYYTYGGDERTVSNIPITWLAYQSENGDHVIGIAENYAKVYYYKSINDVKGANWIDTTSVWYSFKGLDVVVDNESIRADLVNVKDLDGGAHSFRFASTGSDYTFTIDNQGADYTVSPYVYVTYYKFTTMTDENEHYVTLMYVLVTLVIVAILTSIVMAFTRERD